MADKSSKDLLRLEANNTSKSKLLVCSEDSPFSMPEARREKPTMLPLPKSQVLGKVKDFLGVFSESNMKLQHDAKENPENYDIEVLNGEEAEFIEMDLMLGVADLHTPEAVAAAESALAGYQPTNALSESSSESEDEDGSDEDDGKKDDENNKVDQEAAKDPERASRKESKKRKQKPKKRSKIVELS